jgi:hypothetical protein
MDVHFDNGQVYLTASTLHVCPVSIDVIALRLLRVAHLRTALTLLKSSTSFQLDGCEQDPRRRGQLHLALTLGRRICLARAAFRAGGRCGAAKPRRLKPLPAWELPIGAFFSIHSR